MSRKVKTGLERCREHAARLPETIRIGPFDFSLEMWTPITAAANRRYGELSTVELVIRVSTDMASPTKLVDTLLHETMHAIIFAYDMDTDKDGEERIVAVMAKGMTQVHRDNPWLASWITQGVAG